MQNELSIGLSISNEDIGGYVNLEPTEATTENCLKRFCLKIRKNSLLLSLIISSLFIFSGISIFSPNLSQIAKDFGFDEYQRDKMLGITYIIRRKRSKHHFYANLQPSNYNCFLFYRFLQQKNHLSNKLNCGCPSRYILNQY